MSPTIRVNREEAGGKSQYPRALTPELVGARRAGVVIRVSKSNVRSVHCVRRPRLREIAVTPDNQAIIDGSHRRLIERPWPARVPSRGAGAVTQWR
jgi:hypothetical protein